MVRPPEDSGPEVGLTGARFGGAARRRRPARTGPAPDVTPAVPEPTPEPIGLTGARFGGARLRREAEPAAVVPDEPTPAPDTAPPQEPDTAEQYVETHLYSVVRPYVLTRGRTRSRFELPIEALVSARPGPGPAEESAEHARIRELCREPRSVAEVAATAGVPLGVARVLLGDLLEAGDVSVHRTAGAEGPDHALMLRVLAGLRRL